MATTRLHSSRKFGRVIAAVTSLGLVATMAACGGGDDAGDVKGEVRILVSSADASDAAFKEVVDAFNTKYPDVTATLSSVPNDTFPATKSAQLTAGEVDIFVVKTFREIPEYAEASKSDDVLLAEGGALLDLTDEEFMNNYSDTVLESQAIGGRQYAVPTGLSFVTGVYYNKSIFDDNGLSVPTTWTELQDTVATLEAADETAFGIGGKDTWPAGLVMNGIVGSLYPSADDKQALVDGLWNNSVALNEGTQLEVQEKTQWIFEHAQRNFSGAGYDDMPAAFSRGEFAMLPDGTWNQPAIDGAVDGAFEYGYFPLPGSDNAADNASLNGKIELQLGASATAKDPEAARLFLEFFSQPDVYTKFVATSGFTTAQPGIDQSDFLNSIADITEPFETVWEFLWIANNDAGQDAVFPFNYPALAPLGGQTAQESADAADRAWTAAF